MSLSAFESPPTALRPSWYFVASSDALAPGGKPRTTVVADRLLELGRNVTGRVFGRLAGAPVELCERGGLVLAWLGAGAPYFEVEDFACADWTPTRMFHLDLPTSPEQVMRDLADLDHFGAVHGYAEVRYVEPPTYDGASFTTRIAFGWEAFVSAKPVAAELVARVDGLGIQRTEVTSLAGHLRSRHLLMPTPRLGGITRVHASYSVQRDRPLGALDHAKAAGLLGYLYLAFRRDIGRDAQLWVGASDYQSEDSEVLRRFQRWAEQFVPAESTDTAAA